MKMNGTDNTFFKAGWIEVTGVDVAAFMREAWRLSSPFGLGLMACAVEAREVLSEAEIAERTTQGFMAGMIGVLRGRLVKMSVFRTASGRLFIRDPWRDHEDGRLDALLSAFGIRRKRAPMSHRDGCACRDCKNREQRGFAKRGDDAGVQAEAAATCGED